MNNTLAEPCEDPPSFKLTSLLSCIPYKIPWSCVAIHVMHTEVMKEQIFFLGFFFLGGGGGVGFGVHLDISRSYQIFKCSKKHKLSTTEFVPNIRPRIFLVLKG